MLGLVVCLLSLLACGFLLQLLLRSNPREIVPGAWVSSYFFLVPKVLLRALTRPEGLLHSRGGWRVVEGRVEMGREVRRALTVVQPHWK